MNRARLFWRNRFAIPGLDGQKAVLYRSRMNPPLGRNFEAMDPREWRARLADHIPDPGKHRTHFYAHYANRVRGERPSEELGGHGHHCHRSWRASQRKREGCFRTVQTATKENNALEG